MQCLACSFKSLPATTTTDTFRKHCQTQKIPEDAIDLLAHMLSLDPSKRPSAEECLQHPYFQHDPPPMTRREFLDATQHFASSHEFVVKGKAAKRGRANDAGKRVPALVLIRAPFKTHQQEVPATE
jgi:serine/threonine protein kinase